ncbi:MAG TPA: hypothetical protein VLR26_15490 [Frankiaceae bacterium]|nr:hypothetical protein [Frankiaceae bacterium]
MSPLLRQPRRQATEIVAVPPRSGPLPAPLEARVRLSADLVAALLEVEHRTRATLDDLEWADAVAERIVRRRAARRSA